MSDSQVGTSSPFPSITNVNERSPSGRHISILPSEFITQHMELKEDVDAACDDEDDVISIGIRKRGISNLFLTVKSTIASGTKHVISHLGAFLSSTSVIRLCLPPSR